MRNRVTITKEKYNVDTTNKVVVCELSCNMQMSKHPAYYSIVIEMWKNRFPHVEGYGIFKVKAVARCNATDTFDEKIGKRIAESRAKAKAFKTARLVWEEISESLKKYAEECHLSSIACAQAEIVEKSHVGQLCK